jgi:3,4-dihydroxy 2-butanone 4-phosphate synthase/GTP cyclohydrolase II
VRVHEPVSVIDLLDAGSTTHSWNFHDALAAIAKSGCGVLLLLHRQESAEELLARARPADDSRAPPKMTLRNYGIGAQILRDLGVKKMRLMALPRRMPSMAGFDLEVVGYAQPAQRET